MDYFTRLQILQVLREEKFVEYGKAISKYIEPGQTVITFNEINDLKDELDALYNMIIVLQNILGGTKILE